MHTTTLYDAKARLSALVEEVSQTGQDVIITRHGKPIARLAPLEPTAWTPVWDTPARLRPTLKSDPCEPIFSLGLPVDKDDPV